MFDYKNSSIEEILARIRNISRQALNETLRRYAGNREVEDKIKQAIIRNKITELQGQLIQSLQTAGANAD